MKEVCLYMKFGFWLILTTYKVQPIQTGLSNIITRALLDSIFDIFLNGGLRCLANKFHFLLSGVPNMTHETSRQMNNRYLTHNGSYSEDGHRSLSNFTLHLYRLPSTTQQS